MSGVVGDWTEAHGLSPDRADAHSRLGLVRTALGDLAGATEELAWALALEPPVMAPPFTSTVP